MSVIKGLRAATARSPTTRKAVTIGTLAAAGSLAVGEDVQSVARKLSTVDRCIEVLSDSMAKLPNFVIDNRTREHVPHDILYLLNVRPNEAMTPAIRKKVLETSRLEGGNGYDWIIRDPSTSLPKELIPVPWQLVQQWHDEIGRIWYDITHPLTGELMRLPNEDVCHYKNATRNGLKGIGTLSRAEDVIAAARAAQQYDASYYQNGGQPGGVLETDADLRGYAKNEHGSVLTRPDGSPVTLKDQLRSEWEKVHLGPSNAHRTAILDLGLKYTSIASSNRDAQFVENKEISVKDIARYFGVPLYKLNDGAQSYASNEQNSIEYVVSTLHPIVTQYEEEQTYKLLTDSELKKGLEIRINMMAELRGDAASRANWYRTMRDTGVLSVNEIRALEDLPFIDGGDTHYASLNYVPLSEFVELSRQRAAGKETPPQ